MNPKSKYKIGDEIQNLHGMKGPVYKKYFNQTSNEWVYCFKTSRGLACVKESNIYEKSNNKESIKG